MPKKRILVLESGGFSWRNFIQEFFEETPSTVDFFNDPSQARNAFDRTRHELVFVEPAFLTVNLVQALGAYRQTEPSARFFTLGSPPPDLHFHFDGTFQPGISMADFQRQLLRSLPFPEKIRVLIVDDEPEIRNMIRDFLELRQSPSFEVSCAPDGARGLEMMREKRPDVVVLDIKMPVMDGRETYRRMREEGSGVPTIVFVDLIFGDEVAEIRRYGRPAVVEKGAPQSALPELLELIKKMQYFC